MNTRIFAALVAVGVAASSQAWNAIGHRQVADIAWSQLSSKSKLAIARILMAGDTVTDRGKDIVYSVPSGDMSDTYLEKVVRPIFANSANWADTMKYGKSKLFEDRISEDNLESPGIHIPTEGNPGEEVRCKSWHYYDRPIKAGTDNGLHAARESNAIRAIALREKEFEDNSRASTPDSAGQVYSLYWIEHIFGDLHQPLHCVSNFDLDPHGDEGGNTIKLGITRPNSNDKVNLHSYWDSGIDHAILGDKNFPKGLDTDPAEITTRWTADIPPSSLAETASILEPVTWVDAGWELAVSTVYPGMKNDAVPSSEYEEKHRDLCKRQVVLAGYRLANYLNRVLDKK